MAKEKNLTAITTVAAADFVRAVTSAGASVKATFANVAKYVIETYNGSTVAGSAQSVKSALDSLNSKFVVVNDISCSPDASNGFADTGISSNDYYIVGAITPFSSNLAVRISNLDSGTRNYRAQFVNCVSGAVQKSGTYRLYVLTIAR